MDVRLLDYLVAKSEDFVGNILCELFARPHGCDVHDAPTSMHAEDVLGFNVWVAELDGIVAQARSVGTDFLPLLRLLQKMAASLRSPDAAAHVDRHHKLVSRLFQRLLASGPAPSIARLIAAIASRMLHTCTEGSSATYAFFGEILDVLTFATTGKSPVREPPAAPAQALQACVWKYHVLFFVGQTACFP